MYYILHKDGKLIGITNNTDFMVCELGGVSYESIDADIPDLNKSRFDSETNTLISTARKFTKLEFLERFTMTERVSINTSADPIVVDIMKLFDAAEFICADDIATQQGIGYLASIGIITPERMQEILYA